MQRNAGAKYARAPLNTTSLRSCDETDGFKRSSRNGNWPVSAVSRVSQREIERKMSASEHPKSQIKYKTVIQNGSDFIQAISGRNWMQTSQIHSHINSKSQNHSNRIPETMVLTSYKPSQVGTGCNYANQQNSFTY